MLDGFRPLEVCLGIFMAISVIAPQSEQPSIIELIFVDLFTITGLILILPVKKISKYIRGVLLAYSLTVFSVLSLVFHSLVLIESGAGLGSFLTIIMVFYPLIFVNAYWSFKSARL